jgi:hypothetical protein
MAVTDYMTEPGLRALVRDPKSVRTWSQQQIPAFPPNLLPDTELNALITYLKQIASQRVDEGSGHWLADGIEHKVGLRLGRRRTDADPRS